MICQFHSVTSADRMLNRYAGFYDPVCPGASSDRERIEVVYRFESVIPRFEVIHLPPQSATLG